MPWHFNEGIEPKQRTETLKQTLTERLPENERQIVILHEHKYTCLDLGTDLTTVSRRGCPIAQGTKAEYTMTVDISNAVKTLID